MTDATTEGPFDFGFEIDADGVAVLTLDRPDTLNSLTFRIYKQLEHLFRDLEDDDRVKAVVLAGRGKGFCSGGNVEDIIAPLLDRDIADTLKFTRMTGAVVRHMRRLSKPIVAAVHGTAAGAGTVLALASDLRVMGEQASFAFLFPRVGLTGADMGAAWLLPRVVGQGIASEWLLLGDKVPAAECYRTGLANRVVASEQVLATAVELARRLATGPTLAHGMTKRMLVNESGMDLEAAIEQEAQAQALLLKARDHRNFYEAWQNKQKPAWEGR